MGYRCPPGVTIFDYSLLDTFLHLFNVTTGTINCARILLLYVFDTEAEPGGGLNPPFFEAARL